MRSVIVLCTSALLLQRYGGAIAKVCMPLLKLGLQGIHPEDRALACKKYSQYRQGKFTGPFEDKFRVVRPDCSIRWVEVRAFPVRDKTGELVRVAGIAKDVTELRAANNQLNKPKSGIYPAPIENN